MALQYSFPSSIYTVQPTTPELDEIEIILPAISPATFPKNVPTTVKVKLKANTQNLTNVIVRITLARQHALSLTASAVPPGPNPLLPAGAASTGWAYSQSAVEATWFGPIVVLGALPTEFEVQFTATVADSYTYTFSVRSSEMTQPAMTQVDVIVV